MLRFILVLFFILFSCLNANNLKEVSVQLQWKNQFEYAGFYIAKEKGYYKDIGLDVKLKEWNHGIDIVQNISDAKSAYGVVRPSSLIDISKGKDLVYLAAIFQSSPLILLSNKSSGIKSIKDFKNKKIMITQDHIVDSSLVSMFRSQGIEIFDMEIVKHSFDVKSLLNGETDIMAAYISNEPFMLKELGGDPIVFSSKDYGFDFYNDILTVSRDYLDKNKDEVKKFTKATLRGFEYAFNHIDETIDIILKKYNTSNKTKEALLYEAKELKKLAYYKTNDIGYIDTTKLEKIYDVYKLFGLAKLGLDVEEIVYDRLISKTKLSVDEKNYLKSKKNLTVCISPEWAYPFNQIDKDKKYSGLGMDYLNILKQKLHINFNLIKTSSWQETSNLILNNKCDIVPLSIETKEKNGHIKFTTPYLKFPIVITTKRDINFVNGELGLKNKKVAIVKNNYLKYFLKNKHYHLNFVEVKNIQEGFKKVKKGEIFAFLDALPTTIYNLRNSPYYDDLKISGQLIQALNIKIGTKINDEKLYEIIQKTINSISEKEKEKILNKWVPIEYKGEIDYTPLFKLIFIFLGILALSLYWNRKITYSNRLLKETQKEIEQKNGELKKLANTDRLTQLFNRAKIDELLQDEIQLNQINPQGFGVCLLDIDFFKKINDTYGHQVGDKVLTKLAKALMNNSRSSDYIGRWGGEEFLIILPKIKEEVLEKVAEKIREQAKKLSFEEFPNITISIGATIYKKGDDSTSIIKRVDDALYEAKNSGRDCVVKR